MDPTQLAIAGVIIVVVISAISAAIKFLTRLLTKVITIALIAAAGTFGVGTTTETCVLPGVSQTCSVPATTTGGAK